MSKLATQTTAPFLHTVAQQLYQRHQGQMHRLAVVFPNRRQAAYFSHYLQQIAQPPAILPELLTIEALVTLSAARPIANPLVQCFALYDAFVAVSVAQGDKPENIIAFDKFYGIAETLLKDFAELDNYMTNVPQVCHTLLSIEAIDKLFDYLTDEQKAFLRTFWAGTLHKSSAQARFLLLWQRLPDIYIAFHKNLEAQQCTTLGMAYRQLGGNTPTKPHFLAGWDHVAFVGFNAFNRAEEVLLLRWQSTGYCSLWFDADAYYVQQPQQEAGLFLRRNFERLHLQNALPLLNAIGTRTSPIHVVAVQGKVAQAKCISQWLEKLPPQLPGLSAGILLADENLLLPALQSLPDHTATVNVTMGYPLKQSVVYAFVELFFGVHTDFEAHGRRTVHHSFAQAWLNHPFCDWTAAQKEKLEGGLLRKMVIRVPLADLQLADSLSAALFAPLLSVADLFGRLRQLLEGISKLQTVAEDAVLQGLVAACWSNVLQAEPLFAALKPQPTLAFVSRLFRQQLAGITVPFEGEPLQGIQIMGLLESRGLDFEHLLVLGAGEGSLPRVSAPNTFLPDNLRRAFGLPVLEHQDSIFAYVFYRLLHRTTNMTLVYNGLVSDSSTGELSRYAQQLHFETSIPFVTVQPTLPLLPQSRPPISIPRSAAIAQKLAVYYKAEKPMALSPTAINTWLACRLQFFYKYVANLKAPDTTTDTIDAAAFGNIVHRLMERLYMRLLGEQRSTMVTKEDVATLHTLVETETKAAINEAWRNADAGADFEMTGNLLVAHRVAQQYAHAFLDADALYAPFTLHSLEVKFSQNFGIALGQRTATLVLSGKIDRVDEKDGVFRMYDYKTGGDRPEFKSVEALFERNGKHANKAALQTLLYSWMFAQTYPQRAKFEPALAALRHTRGHHDKSYRLVIKGATEEPVSSSHMGALLPQVEQHLRQTLEELFDGEAPFDQTTDLRVCAYCDFKGICGR
ncbi:MAG: PD-(D/E)XK nuclease family protein [Bacteroidetes bacterium]|nr:MAG: PD-(D/E)XK nuclease family protein [Bacteroidota bacterium]